MFISPASKPRVKTTNNVPPPVGLNKGTRALIIRTNENFPFRNLDIWDMGILAMMIESVSSIILNDGKANLCLHFCLINICP